MSNTGPNLQKMSAPALRRRRETLVGKLPPLESLLRGSLIERYKRCGYAGCKCQQDRGHGPKYYLSISQSRRTSTDGLHPAKLPATSSAASGQLPTGARHSQAGLRYQLRTVAAAIGAVRRHDACRSDAGPNRVRPSRNGRVLANMLEAHLASGEPPGNDKEDRDELESDTRSSPETGLHLHSPIEQAPSTSSRTEHGETVRTEGQSDRLGLGDEQDPHPRSETWESPALKQPAAKTSRRWLPTCR